jgi:hypothetical protein
LDGREVEELKAIFKPAFPDVLAHHVTQHFGVGEDHPLPTETEGFLYGYVNNKTGVEAFVVEVAGSTKRPDGKTYHVTWSIDRDKGFKPVDSNRAIESEDWEPLPMKWRLKLTPRYFQ